MINTFNSNQSISHFLQPSMDFMGSQVQVFGNLFLFRIGDFHVDFA